MDTLLKSNNAGVNLHMNVAGNNSLGGSSSPPLFQVRNMKLDFPRFDGSEVLQWIFQAEQFFDYYNTSDTQCLTIAAIHMENEVVPWFQMTNQSTPFQSWIDFTRALELEFGPSPYECTRSQLFKLS